ncbi:MAG: RNA polymerase sigma factor [Candidatus Kapaibacterium sp.]
MKLSGFRTILVLMAKPYSTSTDIELFVKIKDGGLAGESAITELYNRYSSRIHAYCYRVTDDHAHAEDLFQETFIRFHQSATTERIMTNVPGFLMTIARNLCLNYKRSKKNNVPLDDVEHWLADHSPGYEQQELLNLLTRSLELLDEDHREAFVLREYSGMSHGEIAELTGTSIANAKSRVFRAKQKIKSILLPYLKEFS